MERRKINIPEGKKILPHDLFNAVLEFPLPEKGLVGEMDIVRYGIGAPEIRILTQEAIDAAHIVHDFEYDSERGLYEMHRRRKYSLDSGDLERVPPLVAVRREVHAVTIFSQPQVEARSIRMLASDIEGVITEQRAPIFTIQPLLDAPARLVNALGVAAISLSVRR